MKPINWIDTNGCENSYHQFTRGSNCETVVIHADNSVCDLVEFGTAEELEPAPAAVGSYGRDVAEAIVWDESVREAEWQTVNANTEGNLR